MCRMLGLLDTRASSAEPWMVETDHSLLRQSNGVPDHTQADGWGVAWHEDATGPRVVKGALPVFEPSQSAQFRDVAHRAVSSLVIAHIRRASNPMGLPHDRLIALENCQPFVYGSMLFAHNGAIPFPRATRALLGPYEEKVQGVNDSEVLFWLLVRRLEELKDPVRAYARTVADLVEVWKTQGSPPTGPFSGLNILFSRGADEIWAFCLYRGEHGSALLDERRRYFDYAYTTDTKRLLIGSEPFDSTRTDWRDVKNGQYLHAQSAHGLVAVRIDGIPVAPELALRV